MTDEKIYFYKFNVKTLVPELDNVMYNFMNCSQMLVGAAVKYCLTFKRNQPNFQIYSRKQYHNFKVMVSDENNEGAQGIGLPTLKSYAIANGADIGIYDMKSFKCCQRRNVHDDIRNEG